MLKPSLYDHSEVYILVSEIKTVLGAGTDDAGRAPDKNSKQTVFKNWRSFTHCITEIDNTQVDNAKDIDAVLPMYNLIEYSDSYSKTFIRLWQYCRDEPNNVFTESEPLRFKSKFCDNTNNAGIINAKIAVPLKYLSNFWRTLGMSLINC